MHFVFWFFLQIFLLLQAVDWAPDDSDLGHLALAVVATRWPCRPGNGRSRWRLHASVPLHCRQSRVQFAVRNLQASQRLVLVLFELLFQRRDLPFGIFASWLPDMWMLLYTNNGVLSKNESRVCIGDVVCNVHQRSTALRPCVRRSGLRTCSLLTNYGCVF